MINKAILSVLFPLVFLWLPCSFADEASPNETAPGEKTAQTLILARAVMCEAIKDNGPYNEAVVFSGSTGKVLCFTAFDPVPEKTVIYHKWFFRNRLNKTTKLSLSPPRWSTFSSMYIREGDSGPWHVEITDKDGAIMNIIRFSIVE